MALEKLLDRPLPEGYEPVGLEVDHDRSFVAYEPTVGHRTVISASVVYQADRFGILLFDDDYENSRGLGVALPHKDSGYSFYVVERYDPLLDWYEAVRIA